MPQNGENIRDIKLNSAYNKKKREITGPRKLNRNITEN